MRILDYKTVSPLFEMERDGMKPFTIRHIEKGDKRQRAFSQWKPAWDWYVRITNPATGESFLRKIIAVSYLKYFDLSQEDVWQRQAAFYDWRIIVLGEMK